MTAYEDAIRRVIDDARTVRAQDRGDEPVRAAAARAAAAATAGMLTVAPAVPAIAATQPVDAPAQDVADVLVQDLLGSAPTTLVPEPATATAPIGVPPSTGPVVVAIDDVGEVIEDTVGDGPAGDVADQVGEVVDQVVDAIEDDVVEEVVEDVLPGIRPPVIVPLDGRDTEPPPRQTDAPVVVVPPVRPDTPAGGRFPAPPPTLPDPDPDPDDGVDVPGRPTPPVVPVIVGSAPPPAIQGAGTTDITEDFSDLDDTVTTTPIPLGGVTTYVVRAGDSLWSIATDLLADAEDEITVLDIGRAVEVIYEVNRERIGPDPDQLAIGIELEIPEDIVEQVESDAPGSDSDDASTDAPTAEAPSDG